MLLYSNVCECFASILYLDSFCDYYYLLLVRKVANAWQGESD